MIGKMRAGQHAQRVQGRGEEGFAPRPLPDDIGDDVAGGRSVGKIIQQLPRFDAFAVFEDAVGQLAQSLGAFALALAGGLQEQFAFFGEQPKQRIQFYISPSPPGL